MITCPSCSTINLDNAKFCNECGYRIKTALLVSSQDSVSHFGTPEFLSPLPTANNSSITQESKCPNCDTINPYTARFCGVCGSSLTLFPSPTTRSFTTFRSLPKGTIIGGYVIEERVGVGGIGAVYRSRHRVLEHLIAAIKIHDYFPENEQVGIAFKESANFLSQLRHENVVQLIDYGFQGGHAYLAMEYINGPNFAGLIPDQQTKSWLNECLEYFGQLLSALYYAHNCRYLDLDGQYKKGIIHGDIKPQNIFLDRANNKAKLTDFMIPDVQRFLGEEKKNFTRDQTDAFGTPMYMAPEQERGLPTPLCDIYSLGATMFQLVTGDLPNKRMMSMEGRPKRVNPYVPDWLDEMIIKAMEINPSDRFQTVSEMIRFFHENSNLEKTSWVFQAKEVFMGDKIEGNKPSYSIGDISNSTVSGLVQGENNRVISTLNASGRDELALALKTLTDAIAASQSLSADQKEDQVKIINQVGQEAVKPHPNKTLLKILGDGLMATLKAIPDIAPAVATAAPILAHLL